MRNRDSNQPVTGIARVIHTLDLQRIDAPVGPELDAVPGERGAGEVAAELFEAGAIGGGDPDGR